MKRGDVITVAAPGEFGKPRPAVVVQADLVMVGLTVTYVPITSDLEHLPLLRVPILPSERNGLRVASEAMVDRIATSRVSRVGSVVGRLDRKTMQLVEDALIVHLGLA